MHFAPLFLVVFRVIMVGKCTAKGCLLLIYIIAKCLNYSVFLVFIPVFARFFVCVVLLCVLAWIYVLNVWLFMLMPAVDDFQMFYPTLAMLPFAAPEAFFCFSLSSCAMRSLSRPISSACCVICATNLSITSPWAEMSTCFVEFFSVSSLSAGVALDGVLLD